MQRLSAVSFFPVLFVVTFSGDSGWVKNPRTQPIWSQIVFKIAKNIPYPLCKTLRRLKLLHLQRGHLVKSKNFLQKSPWQIQSAIEALQPGLPEPLPSKFPSMYLVALIIAFKLCSHAILPSGSESLVLAPLLHIFLCNFEFPVFTALLSRPQCLARFPTIFCATHVHKQLSMIPQVAVLRRTSNFQQLIVLGRSQSFRRHYYKHL